MKRAAVWIVTALFLASVMAPAGAMTKGERVVEKAFELKPKVSYQRHKYDPDKYIFDCSGFVYTAFKMAGINLKTRDDDRQAKLGRAVAKSDLKPGDIVYFNHNTKDSKDVTHVGIYVGDGKYIHNFNSKVDVIVSDLDSGWHKRYYKGARRVV